MEMIKRLKIVTASYDNNEELKNGKVVKTVQLSKCVCWVSITNNLNLMKL